MEQKKFTLINRIFSVIVLVTASITWDTPRATRCSR